MSARKPVAPKGRTRKSRAFIYAAIVHVIVVVVLITSTDFSSDPSPVAAPQVPIVKAKVVDQKAIDEEVKRLQEAEAKKKREAEKKRTAEKKRRADEIKRSKEAEAKKKREAEKKRAAEKKRRDEEKARENAREEAVAEKKKQEQQKRELAERKKIEEAQAKAEAERAAAALREALENEEKELASVTQARADEAEIARYIEAVRTRVASVFVYPDLEGGLSCTLYVRMIPGGEVVEARVIKSSGNASFDRQAENAVRKAAPLPVPSNPRLFKRMQEINFVFDPEQ